MISSAQLKTYQSLLQKKYRYKYRRFLIEGMNLCQAALENEAKLEILLIAQQALDNESVSKLKQTALAKRIPFEIVPSKVTDSLSASVTPQGVVSIVKMDLPKVDDLWKLEPAELLVLDQIRDPGNLGTILRTAGWFGVEGVILTKSCVDLFNAKVLRSTAGVFFQLNMVTNKVDLVYLLSALVEKEYGIIVADPSGPTPYTQASFRRPFALVIGSERWGVDQRFFSFPISTVCIPKKGKGDSLNSATAAAILLGEAFRP